MGFTKLDEGILQSSIMAEDSDTFKIWIGLLASCGPEGIARVSSIFLSSVCHLNLGITDKALEILEKPDPRSRGLAEEGRRIKRVDGGYFVINYEKYRAFTYSMKNDAIRQRRHREAAKIVTERDIPVTKCDSHGHSASASSFLFSSLKEGDRGRERLKIKPAEFIDRKQELERIFKRRAQPIAGRILDYVAELTFEFPDIDWREEIEKKIASLQDHPFKKGANIALQFRNWFSNARRFAAERRGQDRVGTKDPDRERRMVEYKKAEEALEDKYRPAIEKAKTEALAGRQNDMTKLLRSFTMELNKKKKEMGL